MIRPPMVAQNRGEELCGKQPFDLSTLRNMAHSTTSLAYP